MSALKRTILSVLGNTFLTKAHIAEVNVVSENFRFIDIESEAFKKASWKPGEKVQINTGDWNLRTYTPLSLDPETGRLGILAYVHGNGPGSTWAMSVKPGDPCLLIGPQPSLKFSRDEDSFVLFGDETTIAVAATLKRYLGHGKRAKFVFEGDSPAEVKRIAADLGLGEIEVFPRLSDEIVTSIVGATQHLGDCQVILAGRAQSIQRVRSSLKQKGFPVEQIKTKAYWSEGRTGLD